VNIEFEKMSKEQAVAKFDMLLAFGLRKCGSTHLQNIGNYIPDYTASHPRS
jgi:hypothetical protein